MPRFVLAFFLLSSEVRDAFVCPSMGGSFDGSVGAFPAPCVTLTPEENPLSRVFVVMPADGITLVPDGSGVVDAIVSFEPNSITTVIAHRCLIFLDLIPVPFVLVVLDSCRRSVVLNTRHFFMKGRRMLIGSC